MQMQNVHSFHVGIAVVGIVGAACLYMARGYLKAALSESAEPSHKRLIAFMFALTICFSEIYHTLKKQAFDTQHLLIIIVGALLYSGIATMPQIMALLNRNNTPAATTEKAT